jgi:hypothetical protein
MTDNRYSVGEDSPADGVRSVTARDHETIDQLVEGEGGDDRVTPDDNVIRAVGDPQAPSTERDTSVTPSDDDILSD